MGFFTSALAGVGKLTLGGGGRRMVTGAAIGGIYGAATSQNNSSTGIFRDAMRGATAGLGIGAMTTRAFGSSVFGVAKGLARRSPQIAKAGWGAGLRGAEIGAGVANFAVKHPYASLGIGAVGAGMYGLASSGPGGGGTTAEEMGAIASSSGVSSTGFDPGMGSSFRQNSRAMFMDSTNGLVQGMHRGRHR